MHLMPNPPIPPALTVKQKMAALYRQFARESQDRNDIEELLRISVLPDSSEGFDRHACAALCLYDQTFGFDPSYVENLRDLADALDSIYGTKMGGIISVTGPGGDTAEIFAAWIDQCRLAADRIAALLPPTPE